VKGNRGWLVKDVKERTGYREKRLPTKGIHRKRSTQTRNSPAKEIYQENRFIKKTPLLPKEGWQPLRLTGWFS
jgi:hypothetical protein